MGSNVSSVAGIFAPGNTANTVTGSKEEDLKIQFADLMSQMASNLGGASDCGGESAFGGRAQEKADLTAGADSYDSYQYRDNPIQKQSETVRTVEDDRVKDQLESYEENVKDVLKEELGVTDDEIREAMEQLGITVMDLMNPNQLAKLVAALTGSQDAGQLLCNGDFLNVLKEVGGLTEGLLQELGLTAEELKQMYQMLTEQTGDIPAENRAGVETEAGNPGAVENTDLSQENPSEQVRTFVQSEQQAEEAVSAVKRQGAEEAALQTGEADGEEFSEGFAAKKTEDSKQQTGGGLQQQNHAGEAANMPIHQQQAGNIQTVEAVPEFAKQLDVENIIKQIVEYTKINVSSAQTTLEMQLNPENLGKIYLEITAKQGSVSAHIIAQNELVKEALEAQIVELKQNLNQAGVKVDAVEVAVGSHEFERNLEQNGKQEERQAEEREKATGKLRRLHADELGELAGLMTEEEALVAQMMADQGNSIDYTA